MKRVWYLLKNRRYEGPFALEDLTLQAASGALSPDDYVIDEENFQKSQMIYRRAAEILPKESFSTLLSVPAEKLPVAQSSSPAPLSKVDNDTSRPLSTMHTNYENHESVSALSEGLSRLSFANVAGFCGVVLAATWLFNFQNSETDTRRPAEYAESAKPVKKQVVREVVRRGAPVGQESLPPVERLMPTERPAPRVAGGSGRAAPSRSPNPVQESLNERGLASEEDLRNNDNTQSPSSIQDAQDEYLERPVINGEEPPAAFEEPAYQDEAGMEPVPQEELLDNEGYE